MPLEKVMFKVRVLSLYPNKPHLVHDILGQCLFFTNHLQEGFHVFSGRFSSVKRAFFLPLSHLQRGTSNVPHLFKIKDVFLPNPYFSIDDTPRNLHSDWVKSNCRFYSSGRHHYYCSTIDMSIISPSMTTLPIVYVPLFHAQLDCCPREIRR